MKYVTQPPYIRIYLQSDAEMMKAVQFQKDVDKGAVLRELGWCFEFAIPADEGVLRLFLRCIVGSNNRADEYWSKLVFGCKRGIN